MRRPRRKARDLPTCRHCGQRIIWAITVAGRSQALDPEPNDQGNVLVHRDARGRWRARAATSPAVHLERLYMPHPATCPGPPPPAAQTRKDQP